MNTSVQSGHVTTEGDDLYYEVRGQGQPLLMIPGGGGDGWMFTRVADVLADEYKVILYDRRANCRSTINAPQNFEISQQSRDAVAVLRATGETSAFVVGNSSGAVIALDMAKTQPQAVRAAIIHEPPLARLHPRAHQWQRFFASVHWTAYRFGTTPALLRFMFGAGLPIGPMMKAARDAAKSHDRVVSTEDTSAVLAKLELLPVTNYWPDIEIHKRNDVKIIAAAGKESLEKKRFYAETAPILAKMLGCELVIFPGTHVSFYDMAEEWAATLRDVLHRTTAAAS